MSSILDEPAVRRVVFPVSVEFYHELGRLGLLDKSVELLEGVIIRKMSKSPLHVFVLFRLQCFIAAVLREGQMLRTESPLTTSMSEPEPDLAVVEGVDTDFLEQHPRTALLTVEIAISSGELDRRKAAIYAGAGVREYWLVEPAARRITVFRQPADEGYAQIEVFEGEARLECRVLPTLRFDLKDLFPS